jgi:hypothetical protein
LHNHLHIFLLALALGCSEPASESTEYGLTIRAHSPTASYSKPDDFRLSVTFRNHGDSPLVILPVAIHRKYTALDAAKARYSPFPGPPIPPWRNAFLLAPGQTHVVELPGHRDADGIWILEPGRYELAVRIEVSPDQADSAARHLVNFAAPVWRGTLLSAPIRIVFALEPAA